MTEPVAETAIDEPDTTTVFSPDTTPVSTLIYNKETYLKQTPSSNTEIPTQLEFESSSSETDYDQLKLQTLELWCLQQHKLGNPSPAAADRYQIMRPDHQLGIDAFVTEAIRLCPNLTPTLALKLL